MNATDYSPLEMLLVDLHNMFRIEPEIINYGDYIDLFIDLSDLEDMTFGDLINLGTVLKTYFDTAYVSEETSEYLIVQLYLTTEEE